MVGPAGFLAVLVAVLVPVGRVVGSEVAVAVAGLVCFSPGCGAWAAFVSGPVFVVLVVGLVGVLPDGRVVGGGLEVAECKVEVVVAGLACFSPGCGAWVAAVSDPAFVLPMPSAQPQRRRGG